MHDPFYLTAAILGLAAVVGLIATRLRQPLLVAFIAVGILVGQAALGWVSDAEPIELFAEIGIAVLLFLVGLKLDIDLIRTTGPVAIVTGLGQVLFTSVVGFGLSLVLGLDPTTSIYVAVALTFSSTIIIVKLLSDKGELDELHGRIALGFLIVQDIVVVVVMIVLSTVGSGGDAELVDEVLGVGLRAAALALGLAIAMRWLLPWVMHRVARSQELLLIAAVAWAVSMAAGGEWLGFSTEVGAFLAGFALASTPFREAVGSSLSPLRDFLLLFFFIELGSELDFAAIGGEIPAAIVLSLFVLIGNPLIVVIIMGVLGYRKRVGFLAGLAVAQISEFSLIFVTVGRELGHVDDGAVGLVTLVGLITIALSTYLILYSHPIYERLAPMLSVFERRQPSRDESGPAQERVDIIVYGHGRLGGALVERLAAHGLDVLIVDWDPQALRSEPIGPGVKVVYGDAESATFPASLPLGSARAVVSTLRRPESGAALVHNLRRNGYAGPIVVTAEYAHDHRRLAAAGADLVLRPYLEAGERCAELILGHIADKPEPGAAPDDPAPANT